MDSSTPSPADGRSPAVDLSAIEPPGLLRRVVDLAPGDWWSSALGVAAVAAIGLVGWVLLRPDPPRTEDVIPLATPTPAPAPSVGDAGSPSSDATVPSTDVTAGPVLVHAAGAVVAPGLYELPAGSRVADLVRAAGGQAAAADLDRLNLAEPLVDGSRVYVPSVGEAVLPEPVGPTGPSPVGVPGEGGPAGEDTDGGPVDLNTATLDQLDELPGVGPATAQAIIDHRTASGPFISVDQLLDVRGIGDAKLAQLRDLVTVR